MRSWWRCSAASAGRKREQSRAYLHRDLMLQRLYFPGGSSSVPRGRGGGGGGGGGGSHCAAVDGQSAAGLHLDGQRGGRMWAAAEWSCGVRGGVRVREEGGGGEGTRRWLQGRGQRV
jgi:hypothetical protein